MPGKPQGQPGISFLSRRKNRSGNFFHKKGGIPPPLLMR
jgi:hypothetical protein